MNVNGHGHSPQDKNLKHKSSMMRSEGRGDYKVERSIAMDAAAVLVSAALAFLFWLFL